MDVEELKQACRDQLESGGTSIVLVTSSTLLCGRRGPRGELLCERDGAKVVRFDAAKVLKFILREESRL